MKDFQWIYQHVAERIDESQIGDILPAVKTDQQLAKVPDKQLFSDLTRRVFRAGLKHSLVDSKWPAFELAFGQFNPLYVAMMSDEALEGLMQNDQIIRHWGKIKATRVNAHMLVEIAEQHGSFAEFIAGWESRDITGLWSYLKKHGSNLGGNSGPAFLRMVGKDTFLLTDDVVAALVAQGIISKKPTAQRDLALVQQAFNHWQQQSGWPLSHISRLLSHTVGYA